MDSAEQSPSVSRSNKEGWSAEEKQHRAEERRFWRRGMRVAVVSAAISAVATVVAGLGGFFAYRAFQAAQEQAAIGREANRMNAESGRAWVGVNAVSVTSPVVTGSNMAFSVSYNNYGREPAKDFGWKISVLVYNKDEWYTAAIPREVSEFAKDCMASDQKGASGVIFPSVNNDSQALVINSNYSAPELKSRMIVDDGVASGAIIVVVSGCLTYQTAGKQRHTAFSRFFQAGVTPSGNTALSRGGNDAD